MTELLGEVLLRPRLVGGALDPDYVEREKENLISTIETSLNDKRVYAGQQMLRAMCRDDGFGVPRLGEPEDVAAITPGELYRHYRQVLGTSQVELFYAGSAPWRRWRSCCAGRCRSCHARPRSLCPLPPWAGGGSPSIWKKPWT